jgi:nicotinamide-nucleotide amidase
MKLRAKARPARAPAVVEGLFVGSELLMGQVNTHESYLGVRLRAVGLRLSRGTTLPDDRAGLAAAIGEAMDRCDALLVCGGLGPTFDDLTREAAADALGLKLRFSTALWDGIVRKFSRHRMNIPEENKRQAYLLQGARPIENKVGSAPGQLLEITRGGKRRLLFLLPGPYSEMSPMFEGQVLPRLKRALAAGLHTEHAVLRLSGLPESAADEKLAHLTRAPEPGVEFTILAGKGHVSFHITVTDSARAAAERRLELYRRRVLDAVGEHVFGEGDATLESALGEALLDRGWTISVAESCTGGGVGERLTSVPGSSRWFRGGVIAYDNALKTSLLGVSGKTLETHGAVSAECAREMARGARRACGSTLAVSLTGIAGPGGGTAQKPVGLVHIAVAGPGDEDCVAVQGRYGDGRALIRERAAAAAVALARRECLRRARGAV